MSSVTGLLKSNFDEISRRFPTTLEFCHRVRQGEKSRHIIAEELESFPDSEDGSKNIQAQTIRSVAKRFQQIILKIDANYDGRRIVTRLYKLQERLEKCGPIDSMLVTEIKKMVESVKVEIDDDYPLQLATYGVYLKPDAMIVRWERLISAVALLRSNKLFKEKYIQILSEANKPYETLVSICMKKTAKIAKMFNELEKYKEILNQNNYISNNSIEVVNIPPANMFFGIYREQLSAYTQVMREYMYDGVDL